MPFHIHHYHHHVEARCEVMRRLDVLEEKIDLVLYRQELIMIDTSALVAAAQRVNKNNADMLAVLTAVRDQGSVQAAKLKEVQDQLAAIPADTMAQEAAIAAVVADLNKVADDTEAAIKANTAVPDMPPAPEPTA